MAYNQAACSAMPVFAMPLRHTVTTSWSSLVYLLLVLLLAISRPTVVMATQCVRLPPTPMHASLSVVGWFEGRLHCANPAMDIALNSAGESGTLLCDPRSATNYDFRYVNGKPDCFPAKVPETVKIEAIISSAVPECTQGLIETFLERAQSVLSADNVCNGGAVCTESHKHVCEENTDFTEPGLKYMLDFHYGLTTSYNKSKSNAHYTRLAEKVWEAASYTLDTEVTELQREKWEVAGTRLVDVHVTSWRGVCTKFKDTVGMDLHTEHSVNCRQCSHGYYLLNGICVKSIL